jgi:hypothetical protein
MVEICLNVEVSVNALRPLWCGGHSLATPLSVMSNKFLPLETAKQLIDRKICLPILR